MSQTILRRSFLTGGLAAAGALAAPLRARAQTNATAPAWLAGLEAWLEARRVDWRVPGAAVAIVQGGQLVWSGGFGTTVTGTGGAPVTADTLFRCASSSKQIAGATVAAVASSGAADLDAPVSRYLPAFQTAQWDEYRSINLKDMLSHRTGLPRHDLVWYGNSTLTMDELIGRMPHLAMSAPLRARYQYNNLMVALAGHAAARAAGLANWDALARQMLFTPLGMERTNTTIEAMRAAGNFCQGHSLSPARTPVPVPLRHDSVLEAAGAVNSTVRDFANWAIMQLARGEFGGRRVMTAAAVDAQREPLIVAGAASGEHIGRAFYGLGWRLDTYRGHERVHHAGDLNGFTSRVTLFPRLGLGIIAFVNMGGSPFPNNVVMDLSDRILGLPPLDWSGQAIARRNTSEQAATAAPAAGIAGTQPSRPLSAFAGTYRDPGYGDLVVANGEAGLAARYGDMPARLAHWHYDVFETRDVRIENGDFGGLKLSFLPAEDGSIGAVSVEMEENAPPVMFRRMA